MRVPQDFAMAAVVLSDQEHENTFMPRVAGPHDLPRSSTLRGFSHSENLCIIMATLPDVAMYSTCIYCQRRFRPNEAIEHFPVGRRFAFDATRGRLWVVCEYCQGWNLTPVEERWEAIDECERAFDRTRLRASTGEIGLARLSEGTALVRIGRPNRPEMAAWRYGDRFTRRRRRYAALTGATVVATAGLTLVGPLVWSLGGIVGQAIIHGGSRLWARQPLVRVSANGQRLVLTRPAIAHIELRPTAHRGYELEVPHLDVPSSESSGARHWLRNFANPKYGSVTVRGDEAAELLRVVLPHANRSGAGPNDVSQAIELLDTTGGIDVQLAAMAGIKRSGRMPLWGNELGADIRSRPYHRFGRLPVAQRLALEMMLNEDDERQLLEGELQLLEARWREAEEIAAISDDLLVPADVRDRLNAGVPRE